MWWVSDERLGTAARTAIADGGNEILVSAATVWEIAIKRAKGTLGWAEDIEAKIAENGFTALAVRVDHAIEAGALPPIHRDPFDRMLVAQARIEGLTIVTSDRVIARYGVAVLQA